MLQIITLNDDDQLHRHTFVSSGFKKITTWRFMTRTRPTTLHCVRHLNSAHVTLLLSFTLKSHALANSAVYIPYLRYDFQHAQFTEKIALKNYHKMGKWIAQFTEVSPTAVNIDVLIPARCTIVAIIPNLWFIQNYEFQKTHSIFAFSNELFMSE